MTFLFTKGHNIPIRLHYVERVWAIIVNLRASDIVTVTITATVTVTVTVTASFGQLRNQLPICRRTQLPLYLETI